MTPDGLATIVVGREQAEKISDLLKERVRRMSRMDGWDPDHFHEIWRCARLGYEVCEQLRAGDGNVSLTSLSSEDVATLYSLPTESELEGLFRNLNAVRGKVRPAGPSSPVVCDRMGKAVFEIIEC